jgi:type III secretion system YseE family protein
MYLTCLEETLRDDIDGARVMEIRKVLSDWRLQLQIDSQNPLPPDRFREVSALIDACDAADKIVRIVAHRLASNRGFGQ